MDKSLKFKEGDKVVIPDILHVDIVGTIVGVQTQENLTIWAVDIDDYYLPMVYDAGYKYSVLVMIESSIKSLEEYMGA